MVRSADNGYRIIRDYVDEGISGDATSKRVAFQQMHHAACSRRDFAAILCWDQDRFRRFDIIEAGRWVYPLREAGVSLVTVNDGTMDRNDFTGRVVYTIKQEGKHQFLRDLSANTTRGLLAKAKRGEWVQGKPPYGYAVKTTIISDRERTDYIILGHRDEIKISYGSRRLPKIAICLNSRNASTRQ